MRTPRQMPPFSTLLELTHASIDQVAKHLGVTPRTVRRWARTDAAPRATSLALFWETDAGRRTADNELWNWAQLQSLQAECAKRKNEALRRQVALLMAIIERQDAAANAPLYQIA